MTASTASANLVIRDTDTIQAAMVAIDKNSHRSVVVVNDANVVVGTVSDGDIRRALLDGRVPTTPVHRVMNADFVAVTDGDVDRAKEIFSQSQVFIIPVIDEHGKLVRVLTSY